MKTKLYLILLAMFIVACPVFAQGGPPVARTSTDWVAIASGFGMAIAAAGCALGMGRAIGSATGRACGRNPASRRSEFVQR